MDPARKIPPDDTANALQLLLENLAHLKGKAEQDLQLFEKWRRVLLHPPTESFVEEVGMTLPWLRMVEQLCEFVVQHRPGSPVADVATTLLARLRASEPNIEQVTARLRDYLWSPQGQQTLVSVLQTHDPAGPNGDLGAYIASLTPEELEDFRLSFHEEHDFVKAHRATSPSEPYNPASVR